MLQKPREKNGISLKCKIDCKWYQFWKYNEIIKNANLLSISSANNSPYIIQYG